MSTFNGVEYSLRKRPGTKNYFADFYVFGKRIRRTLKSSDKNVAHTTAKIIITQLIGRQSPSSSISVREFEAKYFTHIEARLRERTVQAHRSAINNLFNFRKFRSLSEITSRDIDEFMTFLMTPSEDRPTPMAPISVNTHIRMLRQIFNQAVRWDYVTENPFNKVRLLKYQQKEPRALSREEIKRILTFADQRYPKYADLFRFYLLTGMRFSEPLELTWENVHWKDQSITLTKTKTKSNRKIPLLKATKRILTDRRDEPRPFAFEPRRVRRVFADIVKETEVPNASIQTLRASVYSYLVDDGTPQPLIRKIIGHTNDTIGQLHYFNLPMKEVLEHTSGLEKLIGKR